MAGVSGSRQVEGTNWGLSVDEEYLKPQGVIRSTKE